MSRIRAAVPDGILAGVMVSIGGAVLLSVDSRYAGAAACSSLPSRV